MGHIINQTIKLCNRHIGLHTPTCSIQCSDIIESADMYMSLDLCINISVCQHTPVFSFKAEQSLGNCSIKTPHHTSWCNISLESLYLGLQNELLFGSLISLCVLWSYFKLGKNKVFFTLTLTLMHLKSRLGSIRFIEVYQ